MEELRKLRKSGCWFEFDLNEFKKRRKEEGML